MKVMPNQIIAHRTAAEAWQYATGLISAYGDKVITEDRKMTREILNLHLCILAPLEGWPIPNSGWDLPALDRYAEQLMNPDDQGFDYTYGNRLLAYGLFSTNQIDFVISQLFYMPESRRAVAITWTPHLDTHNDIARKHVPCLQLLDFLIRGGKLNCTAFFRSHDISRAWVPNVYGLGKLMEYIGKAVNVSVGSLTIVSCSAHIYVE